MSIALCRWPSITVSLKFPRAACAAAAPCLNGSGLSPPRRKRVGTVNPLNRTGSNWYSLFAPSSRGIVCADGEAGLPGRHGAHRVDLLGGEAGHLLHEVSDQLVALPGLQQLMQPLDDMGRRGQEAQRRLVENEAADVLGEPTGLEGADGAVGVAQDAHPLPGPLDDRDHVAHLGFERVLLGVAALPAPAPVDRHDGEVLLEGREDRAPAIVVGRGAVNQHQRRAFAAGPYGDRRAVLGHDLLEPVAVAHASLLCSRDSPVTGKTSTETRPAAIRAAASAPPIRSSSIPMAVAVTMKGSEVAWSRPPTTARRVPTKPAVERGGQPARQPAARPGTPAPSPGWPGRRAGRRGRSARRW